MLCPILQAGLSGSALIRDLREVHLPKRPHCLRRPSQQIGRAALAVRWAPCIIQRVLTLDGTWSQHSGPWVGKREVLRQLRLGSCVTEITVPSLSSSQRGFFHPRRGFFAPQRGFFPPPGLKGKPALDPASSPIMLLML